MQYFSALCKGRKRIEQAQQYINKYTDGKAMPALAIVSGKKDGWEPVGQEIFYAFVHGTSTFVLADTSGYILAIVDENGMSKAIVQGITEEQKKELIKIFELDNISEFKGKVVLPI